MSARKKTTTKATKSPAPATSQTKPAAKTVAKKAAAKAVAPKPEVAAAASIVAAVARVAVPALTAVAPMPAASVREVSTPAVRTTISARIDIGFGNALYLRGEGAGLSWDQGIPMTNLGADLWQIALGDSARPLAFKFLVNDLSWSTGPDYTLAPGGSGTFAPEF